MWRDTGGVELCVKTLEGWNYCVERHWRGGTLCEDTGGVELLCGDTGGVELLCGDTGGVELL